MELVISLVTKHFERCKENIVFDAVQNMCNTKVVVRHIMRETNKIIVILQKDVPGSCSDTCVSSSPDGDGGIEIKTEAVLAVEQERHPVPISFPQIKAEQEVGCMSVFPF
jgi:hypothetical protein